MAEGTVKWFNNAKGWGFIRRDEGPDVFVHYSQIEGDGFRSLREGDIVEFELRDGPRGQFAERVSRSEPPPPPPGFDAPDVSQEPMSAEL